MFCWSWRRLTCPPSCRCRSSLLYCHWACGCWSGVSMLRNGKSTKLLRRALACQANRERPRRHGNISHDERFPCLLGLSQNGTHIFAFFFLCHIAPRSGEFMSQTTPREEWPRALAYLLFSHIFDIDKISEL